MAAALLAGSDRIGQADSGKQRTRERCALRCDGCDQTLFIILITAIPSLPRCCAARNVLIYRPYGHVAGSDQSGHARGNPCYMRARNPVFNSCGATLI